MDANSQTQPIPRLPVLGWASFAGARRAPLPSVLDQRNVLFTTSGRAAIALALRALGVSPGDQVLVPTYHCPTMVAPVVNVGAEPVFFSIGESGAPEFDVLRRMDLDRVRAMLVAHYFGLPQPMARVRRFCDQHGLALIEDCAHAFFGESEGRPVGGWGDYAIASLTKFFPVLEGGCLVSASHSLDSFVLTPRPLLHELKSLAGAVEMGSLHRRFTGVNAVLRALFGLHGTLRHPPPESAVASGSDEEETGVPQGFEFDDTLVGARMTRTTRAIVRMVHRARIVALRRRNYALLAELLADLPGARPLSPALPEHAVPYVFPLRVSNPEPRYRALRAARAPLFRWDLVWPGTPHIPDDRGLEWATGIFQLGCHQDLTEAEVRATAHTVRRVFESIA